MGEVLMKFQTVSQKQLKSQKEDMPKLKVSFYMVHKAQVRQHLQLILQSIVHFLTLKSFLLKHLYQTPRWQKYI